MAARYATETFVIQLASNASHLVLEGSLRDSTHPAVVAVPSKFTTTPPVLGQGHIDPKLYARLQAVPAGTEVT
jgi:hypothetical protein